MCLLFVFLAMMEYAIVLLKIRRANWKKLFMDVAKPEAKQNDTEAVFLARERIWQQKVEIGKMATTKKDEFCYTIDKWSFFIFSACFVVFNIIYFSTRG